MAAGLGFKTFTTGEVLTAADTNGYLMQGILVFASAAARDAAITSPQEGQACYLKDTDGVLTYSGSAWVAVGSSGGMTLLSTTTLSTSSVSISGISASYNNLLIIINGATTATATVLRVQANGSTTLSKIAGYDAVDVGPLVNVIGTLATTTSTSQTAFLLLNNYANTSYNKIGNFGLSTNTGSVHSFGTYLYQSTSAISSITITNSTTVAFTGGQVLIYGVK